LATEKVGKRKVRPAVAAAIVLIAVVVIFGQSCSGYTEKRSEDLARDFVEKSPTFVFDGIADTLKHVSTEKMGEATWRFTYEFQCRHGGYGDRSGQMVTQAITPHQAVIIIERNKVSSAVMDGKWDMLEQKML
jgi:hypothetical protein